MKLKFRLVSTLTMFCLTIALLFVGVWASNSANATLSGEISFKASGVYAKVEGFVEGALNSTNPAALTFSSKSTSPDTSSWQRTLEFDENGSMITFTVKITNLANDRPLYASVTDNYGVVPNLTKTITAGASKITLQPANNGTTDEANVVITLKVNSIEDSLIDAFLATTYFSIVKSQKDFYNMK